MQHIIIWLSLALLVETVMDIVPHTGFRVGVSGGTVDIDRDKGRVG